MKILIVQFCYPPVPLFPLSYVQVFYAALCSETPSNFIFSLGQKKILHMFCFASYNSLYFKVFSGHRYFYLNHWRALTRICSSTFPSVKLKKG